MKTKPGKHRHQDSRGKWTTDKDPDHVHDVDLSTITEVEVAVLRARLAAPPVVTPPVDPPPPPPPPVTPPPSGKTLQQLIDATPTGGTLDLTGWSGVGGASITRKITVKGGTVNVSKDNAITVRAADVILDGVALSGARTAFAGVWAESVAGLIVRNCQISDFVYAGIMVISGTNGWLERNVISRIGVVGYEAHGMNAYGIALSDTGGPPTSGYIVIGNTISDVPQWHGIDSHGGRNLTITDNVIHGCNRGIFLTSSDKNGGVQDADVSRNRLDTPHPRIDVATRYPYNEVGITVVTGCLRVTGSGNIFDGWPSGNHVDPQGSGAKLTGSIVTNPK